MTLLILQPIRPDHPPALRARADALLRRLALATPGAVERVQDDAALDVPPSPSIYAKHAAVRNYMLDTYLRPEHTEVLWVDSDLVAYPPTFVRQARAANPGGITAPLALLEAGALGPNRFYDIGGFIEQGQRFPLYPPYTQQTGDLWDLDSVGCMYLAPAALYHAGVRYRPPPTDYYVEHWSVMQEARARGVRICALASAECRHAWLPNYGIRPN